MKLNYDLILSHCTLPATIHVFLSVYDHVKFQFLMNDLWSSFVIWPEAISPPVVNGSARRETNLLCFKFTNKERFRLLTSVHISHVGAWNGVCMHIVHYYWDYPCTWLSQNIDCFVHVNLTCYHARFCCIPHLRQFSFAVISSISHFTVWNTPAVCSCTFLECCLCSLLNRTLLLTGSFISLTVL